MEMARLLVLLFLVSVNIPQFNSEYYIRRIKSSSNKQHNLFQTFSKTTNKQNFFKQFTTTMNILREKNKIAGSIAVKDKFCEFLRELLIALASAYPEAGPGEDHTVYLLYANISGPTDVRTGDFAMELNTRYACCDKAMRSSRDLFVICGFSGGEYENIPKYELDQNIDDIISEAHAAAIPQEIITKNEYFGFDDNEEVDGNYATQPVKGKKARGDRKPPLEFGPVITL